MKKSYVTMKEIADRLNISRSAVSFALNDRYDGNRISEAVRKKIKETAAEMGYCRNAVVQSLVTGRTRLVAYVANSNDNHEFTFRTISGLIKRLTEKNYSVKFFIMDEADDLDLIFNQIIEQRIEGVFTRTNDIKVMEFFLSQGRARNIPVAFLDKSPQLDGGVYVKTDDYPGIYQAIELLYQQGHRHIGHFGLSDDISDERYQAFSTAISHFEVINNPDDNLFSKAAAEQRRLAQQLLEKPAEKRPTAYLCGSDYIAAILIQEAYKKGLKLPDELSVIGFAGLRSIETLNPDLTTIRQPFEAIGQAAADLLMAEIEAEAKKSFKEPLVKRIDSSLLKRSSTNNIS